MRILICCVAVLIAASIGGVPVLIAQSYRSLIDAVSHFQVAWGVDLFYASTTLDNRYTEWSEPVETEAEADLEILLKGTGVTFDRQPGGTFVLKPAETQISVLRGSVYSSENGKPLRGAHISIAGTSEGTTSGLDGQFILSTTPQNSVTIRFSHVGFLIEEYQLKLEADSIQTLEVWLSEWVIEERPVEVIATALPQQSLLIISDQPFEMDTRRAVDLRQITGVGTPDVIRSLRDIAGLYVDLNTSDIHMQGSGIGSHQFRLDGNVIFEPIHLGLFGIFNPFAIDQVKVRKAGFNAEYGSYLAGIINAEHSLVSDRDIEIQVDPISLNARLTHLLDLDVAQLSMMGAFRTSIWNHWWSNLRSESVNDLLRDWNRPDDFLMRASIYPLKRSFEYGYNTIVDRIQKIPYPTLPNITFNDIHTAAKLELSNRREIGGSLYTGNSNFEGRLLSAIQRDPSQKVPPDRHSWMNHNLRLYWQQEMTDYLRWRISWHRGEYSFSHNYGGLDRQNSVHAAFNLYRYKSVETSDQNGISNDDLNLSMNYIYSRGLLRAGLNLSWIDHLFSIQHIFPRQLHHERRSFTSSGYLQHEWRPRPWVELTTGMRVTQLRVQDRWHIEPRTALLLKSPYQEGYGVSLRLATGVYYQFLNQFEIATISPSSIVPSTRFWIPVDETLRAPFSNHYSIDLSAQLWTNWQFGFEYYYKNLRRIYRIDYPMLWSQPGDSTSINHIDQFVSNTQGSVSGTSVELRRNGEKLSLALRYERSQSKREYTFRDQEPRIFPVPWNVPKQLQARIIFKPIPAVEGIMRWHGAWGRQWAFKHAYYDLLGSDIEYAASFGEYSFDDPTAEGHSLGPYSQLDLGLSVTVRNRIDHKFQLRFDLLNALDRMNPAYRYLQERNQIGSEDQILVDETSYLIGRTFTLSAQFQW